jgi:glycerol-3-phosphate dehydrogenase
MRVDVVVIGGGATGCGIAWDLSLRGLTVAVAEKGEVGGATSGRFHGLLHSGARYAATDPAAAAECRAESAILGRIAAGALDDTGGLFVQGPDDPDEFVERWRGACASAGIPTAELPREEALRREPGLSTAARRIFAVPDAVCRSIELCRMLRAAAEARGARFLTRHRCVGILVEAGAAAGVRLEEAGTGASVEIRCSVVVNAAGPWSGAVAALAGVSLPMDLVRGAMLAFEGRLVSAALNRLRPADEGDIILPRGRVSIAGTTAVRTDDPDDRTVDEAEIQRITERIGVMLPGLREARLAHAWAAVRPLRDPRGRAGGSDPWMLSRDFSVIDHAADGVQRLVSVVGGKLTTFRLMAERASDAVCGALGRAAECRTAVTPIG